MDTVSPWKSHIHFDGDEDGCTGYTVWKRRTSKRCSEPVYVVTHHDGNGAPCRPVSESGHTRIVDAMRAEGVK